MPQPLPLTEQQNPDSHFLEQRSVPELVNLMNQQDQQVLKAVAQAQGAITACIEQVVKCLQAGGRLFYLGAGTSGRLGVLDASECPPTFRTPPEQVQGIMAGGEAALSRSVEGAEDIETDAERDLALRGLCAQDVVVGIAASGHTPYVRAGLCYAKGQGCQTALIACNAIPTDDPAVDTFILLLVGPEIISGSTRLKAGTATKMVLNMISTISMIQLGKVYDNWMVDLQISNQKLQARAQRMITEITELPPQEASELLSRAQGEVKTALLMHHQRLGYAEAHQRLAAVNGHLRQALEQQPGSTHV